MSIERPPWLVRDTARKIFMERLEAQIKMHEAGFEDALDLYRIMVLVLVRRLSPRGTMSMSSMYDLPALPREKRQAVQVLLSKDITRQIVRFCHSSKEDAALIGKLLELAVNQLTRVHCQELGHERKKSLERLEGRIKVHEAGFEDALDLYRIMIVVLVRRLSRPGLITMNCMYDLPAIPREKRMAVQAVFDKGVEPGIALFSRSEVEHTAALAKLLEWSAGQLIWPYHQALEEEEFEHPKLIPLTDASSEGSESE